MSTGTAAARNEEGRLVRPSSDDWLELTSVEDLLAAHPERVDLLLAALDLDYPGLEQVKVAAEAGDRAAACRALLAYYRGPGRCDWIVEHLAAPKERHVELAEGTLQNRARKGNAVGTVPVRHGAWDWNYTGPKQNREFAYRLNRHPFFPLLLQAWRKTGEARFAAGFDRLVRDWVLHTVCPGEEHRYTWTWRVLEAGLRMRAWLPAFHGFQEAEAFTPAGRLLMLSSFVEHGRYIRRHHWTHHNHALMEFDGLNRLGLALPELREAAAWHEYAVAQMLEEMEHQVYPDGAHDELSSSYHWTSLDSYEEVALFGRLAGEELPEEYRQGLVRMYDYWAGLVRPDGSLPQNNRSDRGDPTGRLRAAAERYDRPDWLYIVSNGEEGERPADPPSRLARWAGHLVSRSGWDRRARWSFFDAGPAGAGWVHPDAGHLSVTAWGKDFLVDAGRFWYMRDEWTAFAHSSRSHNVILIDGCDQVPEPKKADAPLPETAAGVLAELDFARQRHDAFRDLDGTAAHTRTLVFLRAVDAWVVVDRIETDRPRTLTPMWRFRPERAVELLDGAGLRTADERGANLSITPVGPVAWEAAILKGQKEPYLQGWYSEVATEWVPSPCAEYRGSIRDEAVFGWILLPVAEGAALPAAAAELRTEDQAAHVRFTTPDGRRVRLRVPLGPGEPAVEVARGED